MTHPFFFKFLLTVILHGLYYKYQEGREREPNPPALLDDGFGAAHGEQSGKKRERG